MASYTYRVGDGTYWSKHFSFTTEPVAQPPERVVRIVNIGDMGANMSVSGPNMRSLDQVIFP